jgi:hypothetical protein
VAQRRLALALVAAAGGVYALAPASANAATPVTLTNDSDLTFTYSSRSVQPSDKEASWTGQWTPTVRWSLTPQPVGDITWGQGTVKFVARYDSSANGRNVWLDLEVGNGASCLLQYERDATKDPIVKRVPGYTCTGRFEQLSWFPEVKVRAEFTLRHGS